MCQDEQRALTFETILTDPLIRLMMASDGVTLPELVQVLEVARQAVAAREAALVSHAEIANW